MIINIMNELIPLRRYVNPDNSCLFSSIGYLMECNNFNEMTGYKYRMMIAEYLLNTKLDDTILDRPQSEYLELIQDITKWGGAPELRIFSDMFKVKIGSFDILSDRVDIFGETKDYNKIIYVMYTGSHYDPLVMNFSNNGLSDTDITKFDYEDFNILLSFREYVKKFKDECDDLSSLKNFKCEICSEEFENQEYLLVHAQNKDHWKFKQI